jgi:hypothetical protein
VSGFNQRSRIEGPAKDPTRVTPKHIAGIGDYPVVAPGVVRTYFTLEDGRSFWLTLTHTDALQMASNLTSAVTRAWRDARERGAPHL